jgi:hypothetical protein
MNIWKNGLGFLRKRAFPKDIIVTKHGLPGFEGRKVRVLWVRKGIRYFEAWAAFS